MPSPSTMTVNDVHCHFLSPRFLEALGREKHGPGGATSAQVARELGWDDPCSVELLADRWVAELDRHRVSRSALIGSVPGMKIQWRLPSPGIRDALSGSL